MGITVRHGAEVAVPLGREIGRAEAQKEAVLREAAEAARGLEVAARMVSQSRALAHQEDMFKRKIALEEERDVKDQERRFAAEEHAKDWQIEKMAMVSQQNFIQEEAERMEKITNAKMKVTAIKKGANEGKWNLDDPQVARQLASLEVEAQGGEPLPASFIKPPQVREERPLSITQQRANITAAMEVGMYDAEELREMGLDPADYPGIDPGMVAELGIDTAAVPGLGDEVEVSPYEEYPDAFMEDGIWKVMRNGKKYRIED